MRKIILFFTLIAFSTGLNAQRMPFQDPDLSAKERARDLCSRLTLEEKAMLMQD